MRLLLIACFALGPAFAAPILPTSYDLLNGGFGGFTYYDDTYPGGTVGCPASPAYCPLTGGLGQLTDGVVSALNWIDDPFPWVGWMAPPDVVFGGTTFPGLSAPPEVTFFFSSPVDFGSAHIVIHVDDSDGAGNVFTPLAAHLIVGGTTVTTSITDPAGGAPHYIALDTTGLGIATSITLRLDWRPTPVPADGRWIMLDEVTFHETPEPSSILLLGCGLAALAAFGRRSRG